MPKPESEKNLSAPPAKGEFETILGRLEQIVGELEGGNRSLEDSLALFEEGVKISREGHVILDRAEMKVQTLLESGETVDGISGQPAQPSSGAKRG